MLERLGSIAQYPMSFMVNVDSQSRYITVMKTTNLQPGILCTLNITMMTKPQRIAPRRIHGRNLPFLKCEPSIIAPMSGSFIASQMRPPTPMIRLSVVNCASVSETPN